MRKPAMSRALTPPTPAQLSARIRQALGQSPSDLVVKNVRILDLVRGELIAGDIAIAGDRIVGVRESYRGRREIDGRDLVAVPGFVDAHVHIESSVVTPAEFDRAVLVRGTTTAVCDPHEISNVLGLSGLRFFLDSALGLAMDLRVKLPSCVPATDLETSGARLDAEDLLSFRNHPAVIGLAEMMNFSGVLRSEPGVLEKLAAFQGSPIDGHAPLLCGRELNAYAAAGIRNDHESTSRDGVIERLRRGLQVFLREGSAAKSVAALAPLITDTTSPFLGFCTDDRSPLDIAEEGHIDHCIRTALAAGAPIAATFRAASWAAARELGLNDRGLLAPGWLADIVLLEDVETCSVHTVIRGGEIVDDELFAHRKPVPVIGRHSVKLDPATPQQFAVPACGPTGPVIGLRPDHLVTDHLTLSLPFRDGQRLADATQDVLKVCVLARHGTNRNIGRGFAKGFGLRNGALASSVGHDSHNVIVVGDSDRDMTLAVNRLITLQGGFVAVREGEVVAELPLPLAGLMSDLSFDEVCQRLSALRRAASAMGCRLREPFLSLSFLTLPVIPHLKITDRGLVDVDRFELIAA
jgi:adenine deaminase